MKNTAKTLAVFIALSSGAAYGLTKDEAQDIVSRLQPGGKFTEMRNITTNGQPAVELEYVFDGDEYEVIVDANGTVLDHYKDSGMPVIVSLALDFSTQLYQEQSSDVSVIPVVIGNYKRFWFRGLQHGFYAYKNPYFSISPMLKFNPDYGYSVDDADDNSTLYEGLDNTDFSLEGGLQVAFNLQVIELEFNMLTDLLGDHEGQLLEVSFSRPLHMGRVLLLPELKYTYSTEEVGQFYFGVDPENATVERPAFEVGTTNDLEFSTVFMWQMTTRWYVVGEASYKIYDDVIEDSPLVDDTQQASLFVGVGLSF